MPTKLNPYLHFHDETSQAMEFYQSVFGGTLNITTFKEFPGPHDPRDDDKIMHAQLDTDTGLTLMASDAPSSMGDQPVMNGSISFSGENAPSYGATSRSWRMAARSSCHWRPPAGAIRLACAPTSLAASGS